MDRNGFIWITWEHQRRSVELAAAINAKLFVMISNLPWVLRTLQLGLKTLAVLFIERPKVLFVQNPSMVLASFACALKPIFRYRLVVDRHSNFKFHTMNDPSVKYRVFHLASKWTVKRADLTIVTNSHLKGVVERWGGRGFILQDKLPQMRLARKESLGQGSHVVCISSFGQDEPIDIVIQAARLLPDEIKVHVTGNEKRCPPDLRESAPSNVIFTGFLPEAGYQTLIASADVVMVLTKQDFTLLCGAYEAISLGRPLILSATTSLKDYFGNGVVYTENTHRDIAASITQALANQREMARGSELCREILTSKWNMRFEELNRHIDACLSCG